MQDFYRFASESPFLTFFLFWLATWLIYSLCKLLVVLFRGWPENPYED